VYSSSSGQQDSRSSTGDMYTVVVQVYRGIEEVPGYKGAGVV
jgi:hypothetical protein